MATLIQFSRNIRKRGSQIENSATRMVKASAKKALRSLVLGTRVDKGVARSNWRVGLGAPTRSVIGAYTPYPRGSKGGGAGMSETANTTATIAAGNARINSIGKGGLKTAIFITNSVPYPKQAFPRGMIETAILEARFAVRNFRIFSR